MFDGNGGGARHFRRAVVTAAVAVAVSATATVAVAPRRPDPVVIAIVGEAGLNVLHSDFARAGAPRPSGMPGAETIRLPSSGSFGERLAAARAGALGHLRPGRLYRIADSRIAGIVNPAGTGADTEVDVFANPDHGTGVVSAAVGRTHGTAPDAVVVVVLGASQAAWRWIAGQPWIDVVSASYFGVGSVNDGTRITCVEGASIDTLTTRGRPVFVAAGNGDEVGVVASPSGHPDVYRVGGVTRDGRTWLPHDRSDGAVTPRITPNRPYDTGELFSFPAAAADSLSGEREFGGTSGAAPRTAGHAARLIADARRLLGARNGRPGPALASTADGYRAPKSGPLNDGVLTREELLTVLRHTAIPYVASPHAFAAEGYGAVNARSIDHATRVLRAQAPEPRRDAEDAYRATVDEAREAAYADPRCRTP